MARIDDGDDGLHEPPPAKAGRSDSELGASSHCAARHSGDGSPCEGDQNAVRIVVGQQEVLACVNHAARLLASVSHAEVYPVGGPDGPDTGAAAEVARRAAGMGPFFWMHESLRVEAASVRAHRPHFSLFQMRTRFHERPSWKP